MYNSVLCLSYTYSFVSVFVCCLHWRINVFIHSYDFYLRELLRSELTYLLTPGSGRGRGSSVIILGLTRTQHFGIRTPLDSTCVRPSVRLSGVCLAWSRPSKLRLRRAAYTSNGPKYSRAYRTPTVTAPSCTSSNSLSPITDERKCADCLCVGLCLCKQDHNSKTLLWTDLNTAGWFYVGMVWYSRV